ncbi:hypothetical protein [Candidatus Frankia nodulisporulans]|uniref:hypothetical protein n=1 Tax=Candidatus Frankia nodulisporulans TaxID=2060052 RepID=UPI0013D04361|nr:hypothetical protein [Candidatus Frankia nodulisporulans]
MTVQRTTVRWWHRCTGWPRGRRLLAVPVLLVALAACGSSGGGSGTQAAGTAATTATAAPSTSASAGAGSGSGANSAMTAYRTCLAQNGVTLPTPSARPQGDGSGAAGTRPTGAPPSGAPGGPGGAGGPGGGGGPGRGGGFGPMSTAAPAGVDADTWAAARSACASLLPTAPAAAPTAQATSA